MTQFFQLRHELTSCATVADEAVDDIADTDDSKEDDVNGDGSIMTTDDLPMERFTEAGANDCTEAAHPTASAFTDVE
jgi:hypothetical protein